MSTPARPMLDRTLYRPSHRWAAAYCLYALSLFTLPALLSYGIAIGDQPLWLKIPCIALLSVLAAYGINMMGFVGHEGMHGSLLRNRKASALLGIFSASAVLTYFELGFAVSHWNHHRYTNQEDDPDIAPVRHLDTWWKRLLFSRLVYNTLYFKYTLSLARGKPTHFKYKMAYAHRDQVLFARLNFVFAALWAALYLALFIYDWRTGVFCVALPMLTVNFIGACQIYIDHAGLDARPFGNAWSRTSPLMTVLFFGANYHLEHHAYPGIPCYRLPKVHRLLKQSGFYATAQPAINTGFWSAFRPLARPYIASPVARDEDPFRQAVQPEAASSTRDATAADALTAA
jgi:beta-carotene hydroxylase